MVCVRVPLKSISLYAPKLANSPSNASYALVLQPSNWSFLSKGSSTSLSIVLPQLFKVTLVKFISTIGPLQRHALYNSLRLTFPQCFIAGLVLPLPVPSTPLICHTRIIFGNLCKPQIIQLTFLNFLYLN